MKGPSLDAIRKFKQQQEQKKRDEEAKRFQDKINTLRLRASQGDRKAKAQLNKIEEESKQAKSSANTERSTERSTEQKSQTRQHSSTKEAQIKKKPASEATDFEELMRLAQSNCNEIRKQEKPTPRVKKIKQVTRVSPPPPPPPPPQAAPRRTMSSTSSTIEAPSRVQLQSGTHQRLIPGPDRSRLPPSHHHLSRPTQGFVRFRAPVRRHYEDEDDYEDDDYESDGFVVDEDEDEARAELNKTLKDVFRYDKRRADRLEHEVDMHYRAIGRVSTFDDLEREERRASRLAQAEDAKEQRKEEERKRLKKQRLKGLR